MAEFHYVSILTSENEPTRHYTGQTDHLSTRLDAHNEGRVPHTAKHRPWRIETALAFRSKQRATEFERYLKSHAGRAFARKRL